MKINIFTYGSGYDAKIYERFIGSLFDSGFNGKLYCFIKDNDVVQIEKISKELFSRTNWINNTNEMLINNSRFLIYNNFVSKTEFSFDEYTFFCDFRDVLFQKNICEYRLDKNIDMFLFREDQITKNCPHNSGWLTQVRNAFPSYRYDYENEHIICSGTILVKNTILKQFLDIFCNNMNTVLVDNLVKGIIIDQAIHNFLYYNNLYPFKTKILTNEDNLVNTLCYSYHKINENNQITNYINDVSYVAHQYDRMNFELKQKLSNKYDFATW